MNKKGIGPIIAFVLLMALSVTLGAFVTIWYTKSTEGQVKTVIEKYGNADECSDVRFDVAFDYENCIAAVYNLGSFTIDKIKVDRYLSTDLTNAKTEIWATGKDSLICAEFNGAATGLFPKNGCGIPMNTSSAGDVPNSNPRKLFFSPITTDGDTDTLCLNEREFTPNGSKFQNC